MVPTNFNRKTKKICLSKKKVVPLRAFCCKNPQKHLETYKNKELINKIILWQHYNQLEIMALSCS
jgi:hypothetical protein